MDRVQPFGRWRGKSLLVPCGISSSACRGGSWSLLPLLARRRYEGPLCPLPMLSVAWPPVQYTRRSIWYFASLFPQRFDQSSSSRQGRINALVVVHQYQPVKPWLIHLNISRRGDPRFVVKATLRTQKICQRQACG
ncbi:hypothetical protein J3E68DRAFT_174701 [Trichoderma sp. SZMC 28012]